MRSTVALSAVSAFAAAALLSAPQAASAWTGDAYVDGGVPHSHGTGTASWTVDGDPDGAIELSGRSVGGTKFLVPILNIGPYSTPTTVNGYLNLSDAVPGFPGVEAGQEYRVTVTYSDLDVETATKGNGRAGVELYAQAAAGSDGAGHALIAGSNADPVTEDGDAVLSFEFEATQDSGVSVQAGVRVQTSATGKGNEASAAVEGEVADVQIVEVG